MKKIFIAFICIVMICAMPLVAFAEDEISTTVDTNVVETETLPTETETTTEGEISGSTDVPTVTTDEIVKWVEDSFEEISVIVSLIVMLIYQVRKHTSLNKSIATCNNNAVSIVENSNSVIQAALARVEEVAEVVVNYKDDIVSLLGEISKSDEEKKRLESALTTFESYMKSAKLANKALADELADLLLLANIPNSKKEELYSRHLEAVRAIVDAEKTEVKEDVGEES